MPIYHMPIMGSPKLLAKIAIIPMLKLQSVQSSLTFLLGRAGYGDVVSPDLPYYYYNDNKEITSRVKILVDAAYFTGELYKLLDLTEGEHKHHRSNLLDAIEGKEIIKINKIICEIVANTSWH